MMGVKVVPRDAQRDGRRAHQADGCARHRRRGAEHQSVLVQAPTAISPRSSSGSRTRSLPNCARRIRIASSRFATTAMQHPDLAVQQLEYGVKKLGLRGMSVGTHVDGEELSNPKFHPIWAESARNSACLVFMHPIAYARASRSARRQWRAAQHYRQSARYHDRALAHDLRRYARSLSRAEALLVARWRFHRVLRRPLRRRLHHLPGPLQGGDAEEEADRVSAQISTTTPSSSTQRRCAICVAGRREPDHARHRLSVPVVEDSGHRRHHPEYAGR